MTALPQRHLLPVDPLAFFKALPAMGRLMIFSTNSHVTHERIGRLDRVEAEDGWARFSGPDHDSRLRLGAIRDITVNRSRKIGDKSYPRIEINGEAGEIACVVGFEGLEPFDKVLAPFGVGEPVELVQTPFNTMPGDQAVGADDPGSMPLEAARRSGAVATVAYAAADFEQSWRGVVPELRISHGFINIMEPGFHLHIRGGSIAAWDETVPGRFDARAADGGRIGFFVDVGN